MRGDAAPRSGCAGASGFNPRPSHEGRLMLGSKLLAGLKFQSTPLA